MSTPTSNEVHRTNAPLDILFLQDATETQQPYIDTARNEIKQICNTLLSGGKFAPQDIRFGLVAFRDHPPQEDSFVTQEYPFTSDVASFASDLASLTAEGGGDEPDCQGDALVAAYKADWRDEATKVVVLVTDSLPHGVRPMNNDGDGFPLGCPLQHDPLSIATSMGKAGITLYVIACEPTLSQNYGRARGFYQGLAKRTGGKMVDLSDLSVLPTLIAGSALEAVDSELYVTKHRAEVRSIADKENINVNEISLRLHKDLVAAGVQHSTLVVDNVYHKNFEAAGVQQSTLVVDTVREQQDQHVDTWFNAENLGEGRNKIQQVGGDRVVENYQANVVVAEQSAAVETQPISLAQVETVVHKCLVRAL
ncbi:uncharacterized protein EDB93DRAFT_1218319 [Suillus bovinus]|uniref:uncharacterized protein n=1 Tax=Suillus bovinus TaxID=48563 RepID=UPI001B863549|nr:uncharacterized protein EDB93DRAFT_1218319 [Suillus bovinus]KAG2159555.1 hypothetical protein EDB93DRAFT_1218319 [Suillus bovinus]